MVGFGKQVIKFMKCPLEGILNFERCYPDPKMLMFMQPSKYRFIMNETIFGVNGKRDGLNISLLFQIYEV